MSQGALSVALVLGGVNAACTQGPPAPAAPAPIVFEESSGAPVQVWTARAGRRLTGRLVVAGETIYGAGIDRKVYAVDLITGQQRWASRLGGMILGGVLVDGDTVFAASGRPEGRVYALDAATGRRLWRTGTGAVAGPLALVGRTVVAGTYRGIVTGLDPTTGAVRWRRRLGTTRIPAIPGDSGSTIIATVDSLFRLSAETGRVLAHAASPGTIVSPWLLHHGLLVAGTTDSLVVGIDPHDLRPRWRVTLDAPVLDAPAAAGDTIYAVTRRGSVYRIGTASEPVAARLAELRFPVTAPVVLFDGLLLLGGADGTVRALRPDGTEAWRLLVRLPVDLGPVLLDDGLLAVGGGGDLHRYRR